jgi:uncharacterized coiled-coil protein SlyX
MVTPQQQSSVKPALDALAVLRTDVLERIGKDGGNLNGKLRANFAVIEATLAQFDTIESMNKTIGQQSQLVAKIIHDMSRMALPAADINGDDGSSTTKGA